ncbi:MAG: IS21 family transposase [Bryobacteraceae bacterium]
MAEHQAIIGLARQNWSYRRIAAELGVDRGTVSRHAKAAAAEAVSAPRDPPGVGPQVLAPPCAPDANAAISITGSPVEAGSSATPTPDSNAAIAITGSGADAPSSFNPATVPEPTEVGRASDCEGWRAEILAGLERGLTARRIWQDLQADPTFKAGYQSVQRLVRKLKGSMPALFRRMECGPGEEAQVDFGKGAPVVGPDGKRTRPHLFRIVLSCSRKAYSEVVTRQTTEQFIRCIENAFVHFGGVPKTLIIDNLKAAVSKADWYDPELNPKVQAFAAHYRTVVLPTRPYTPRHKGKIERQVGYTQSNALKGRTFNSLAEQNRFLQEWEASVADTRIHGTTRKQVGKAFEELERPALLPLPAGRFPCFQEAQRIVNRDGHVEVAKAYYSAPPEFVGRTVWARWDGHVVRLFDQKLRQIAIHAQHEPGRFATDAGHIAPQKRGGIERGTDWWLSKAAAIGIYAGLWAQDILHERGVHGVRALIGLVSLTRQHPAKAIEHACQVAQSNGARRLRDIRNLLKRANPPVQEQFEFIAQHPLIRPLSDYSQLIHAAFDNTPVEAGSGFVGPAGPPPFEGDGL